jgi:alcohol dehydrogenase (cytochrome c)
MIVQKQLIGTLLGMAVITLAQAADVTSAMLTNTAKNPNSVLSFGMGSEGQRYSPLTQINTKTVAKLIPAWAFSFGGEKQRGQESQPLIHNGKMFVTASYSRIFAIDLKSGAKLWKYEHRLPDGIMPCCDVVNRGAALYGNLVIFGTLDANLVALDQDTGKIVWKEKVDDYAAGYSMTSAPLIAKGLLLTGVSGGEFGIVGRVEARDPMTGQLVWTRPTVEGHMGFKYDKAGKATENGISGTTNKSWPGDLWKTGGAATWMGGTYDSGTGLAYFGTGNPAPWNSHLRPGDNLYSSSTVALDVGTGQIKWAYQNTPNDAWDFDGANERQGRSQWLLLRDRRQGRQAAERLPVRQEDHLGHRHRSQDRTSELRRGQSSGRPDQGRRWEEGRDGILGACLPRCEEPDADGVQPADQAVLRAGQRMGHGHLE